MFTGLIEELGSVQAMVRGQKSVRLTIAARKVLADVRLGDSIAVNGTCLTVVDFSATFFTADIMPETVERTVLATLQKGDKVNLERTLAVGDRLGGHIVTGHIDGVGRITEKRRNDNAVLITLAAPAAVMKYIVPKGSVAIDGISLTVVEHSAAGFTVSLIPHTAAATTLGFKQAGDPVNLETDIIGKYVAKMLQGEAEAEPTAVKGGLTRGFLAEHGF
ncbi:MAG TPA: riboflavin synthase [Negativicutes bacterium]|nr:riboflavin synthase [Negativicutes bacterium]